MTQNQIPIIDSHIHLYAQTHLPRLNWTADLPSDHILNRQNSVEQYKLATRGTQSVRGFVFVETDRKFSLEEDGWKDPLEEVAFLARIAQGQPIEGEGHVSDDSRLVLGIVPWAPLPAGPTALDKYVTRVKEICGSEQTSKLVKGYRYLVQDKPAGTMSDPKFVEALRWLGDQGLTFDLGVDLRQGGIGQLQEACRMLDDVFRNGNELKVVINHFCKPNLRLSAEEAVLHDDFAAWSECIKAFACHRTTYMKLSGFFSEFPPQVDGATPISELLQQAKPWLDVVFSSFGPGRIMFGSDWPVCSAGGPGTDSWQHWVDLVSVILDDQGLSMEEKRRIWAGTATEAYSINASDI